MNLHYLMKELYYRKRRTLMAILGLSIGIALLIVLNSLSLAYRQAAHVPLKEIGADITVQRSGDVPKDLAGAVFPCSAVTIRKEEVEKIQKLPGVRGIGTGLLLWVFDPNRAWIVLGIEKENSIGPSLLRSSITEGRFSVGGDIRGAESAIETVNFRDPGNLSGGHLIVNGAFGDPGPPGPVIIVHNQMDLTSFIGLNYDAPPPTVSWRSGTVDIGSISYHENTSEARAARVWGITACRGDMDGNGAVDFNDINPFVEALQNVEAYSRHFPGLGSTGPSWDPAAGSRSWHGDCNCDGVFDFNDINPFVAKIGTHSCDCLPAGDPPSMAAEVAATGLRAHVLPENRVPLLALVAQEAGFGHTPAIRAYWQSVLLHLQQ